MKPLMGRIFRCSRSHTAYSSRKHRFKSYAARISVTDSRSISKVVDSNSGTISDDEEKETFFKDFLGKTWYTYKATPLYKFEYTAQRLKQYSSALSAFIEAAITHSVAAAGIGSRVRAIVSILNGMTKTDEDENAIQIRVFVLSSKNGMQEKFCCYLCSVGCQQGEGWLDAKDKFVILPLILARGSKTILREVLHFLREKFSCFVSQLLFPPIELNWIASLWATLADDAKERFKIVYRHFEDKIFTLEYSLNQKTVKKIWSRIHNASADKVDYTEMKEFTDLIENHFEKVLGFSLKPFYFAEVMTSAARVGRLGKLKVFSVTATASVLKHLTFLCQQGVLGYARDD